MRTRSNSRSGRASRIFAISCPILRWPIPPHIPTRNRSFRPDAAETILPSARVSASRIGLASSSSFFPAAVSQVPRRVRKNKRMPRRRSIFDMAFDNGDCSIPTRAAARAKWSSSASTTKYLRSRTSKLRPIPLERLCKSPGLRAVSGAMVRCIYSSCARIGERPHPTQQSRESVRLPVPARVPGQAIEFGSRTVRLYNVGTTVTADYAGAESAATAFIAHLHFSRHTSRSECPALPASPAEAAHGPNSRLNQSTYLRKAQTRIIIPGPLNTSHCASQSHCVFRLSVGVGCRVGGACIMILVINKYQHGCNLLFVRRGQRRGVITFAFCMA
jgi:hypothetical protein